MLPILSMGATDAPTTAGFDSDTTTFGTGTAFLSSYGAIHEIDLAPGQDHDTIQKRRRLPFLADSPTSQTKRKIDMTRMKSLIQTMAVALLGPLFALAPPTFVKEPKHIDIGSRRELFVDSYMIADLDRIARRGAHHRVLHDDAMVAQDNLAAFGDDHRAEHDAALSADGNVAAYHRRGRDIGCLVNARCFSLVLNQHGFAPFCRYRQRGL